MSSSHRRPPVDGDDWPYDRSGLLEMLDNEADMSFPRRADAVFDMLRIGPTHRVLDMGCGRGFYLKFLSELYPDADVVGVELDRPLLLKARREVPGAGVVNADVYRLPFPDGHFDRVLFSEVIEHIPDDRAALAELHRVMAPGGIMAVTTPNADYPWCWDPINRTLENLGRPPIRDGVLSGIWANHVRLYTPESLARRATNAGFEVEEVRPFTRYCFPFIHNLVYGVGKELLEAGALPSSVARSADRFATRPQTGPWWNPVRWGLAAFKAVDRLNDIDPPSFDRPFLIIAMQLRKPDSTWEAAA